MKHLLLILSTLLLSHICWSQNLSWAKEFNGGMNNAFSIKTDNNCNVYTVGDFIGTVDFDPNAGVLNLTSSAFGDAYVTKLDSSGNLIWAKNVQGTGPSISHGVAVDAQGNVYYSGQFDNTVDFDPGVGVFNLTPPLFETGHFISKLDSNGNFLWAKNLGKPLPMSASNKEQPLKIESTGNLIIRGLDSIYKVSPAGNVIWSNNFIELPGINSWEDFGLDNSDDFYTFGYFQGISDFDPGPGVTNLSAVNGQVFFAKYTSTGGLVWAKQINGNTFIYLESMITDANGDSYYTGFFNGTRDFDPGPGVSNMTSGANDDVFLLKLDANGIYQWSISFGGTNPALTANRGMAVDIDAFGNVIVAGNIIDTVDIDPGPTSKIIGAPNGTRSFIAKYDANGNFLNGESFGDPDLVGNIGNLYAKNNETYLTGSFFFSNDFYPGPNVFTMSSFGGFETFIMKLDMTVNIPLPLNELSFSAIKIDETKAKLRWKSLNENIEQFEVQRSNNGLDWKTFTTVMKSEEEEYSAEDQNPFSPATYYRLKLRSQNNTSVFSDTKKIVFNNDQIALTIYPNPSSQYITLSSSKEFTNSSLDLFNAKGQIVLSAKNINGPEYQVDISKLVNGIYTLELSIEKQKYTKTILKK